MRRAEPLHAAAFLVDGQEQRPGRGSLQRARQLGQLGRIDDVPLEENHSGDPAPDQVQLLWGGGRPLDTGDQAARGELLVVHGAA